MLKCSDVSASVQLNEKFRTELGVDALRTISEPLGTPGWA
jgi:hypothetical protein